MRTRPRLAGERPSSILQHLDFDDVRMRPRSPACRSSILSISAITGASFSGLLAERAATSRNSTLRRSRGNGDSGVSTKATSSGENPMLRQNVSLCIVADMKIWTGVRNTESAYRRTDRGFIRRDSNDPSAPSTGLFTTKLAGLRQISSHMSEYLSAFSCRCVARRRSGLALPAWMRFSSLSMRSYSASMSPSMRTTPSRSARSYAETPSRHSSSSARSTSRPMESIMDSSALCASSNMATLRSSHGLCAS